jgi:hypothetical protein
MSKRKCVVCDGTGQVWHGDREPDTGAPITWECPVCDGYGEIDDEICGVIVWYWDKGDDPEVMGPPDIEWYLDDKVTP